MTFRNKPIFSKYEILLYLFFGLLFIKILVSYDISDPFIKNFNFSVDALLLCILVWGACILTPRSGAPRGLLLAFFLLTALAALSDIFSGRGFLNFFTDFPKLALPWICFYFLNSQLGHHPSTLVKLSSVTTILILILVLVGFLLLPRPLNKFHYWMPAYFSGLHKSAYVILNLAFVIFAMTIKNILSLRLFIIFYGLGFLLLLWGWGVRSATICMLIFPLIYLYFISRLMKQIVFLIIPVVLIGFLLYVVLTSKLPSYHDLSNLSSGRLEMWQLKLNLIAHSSAKDFLLGRGSGSDFIFSDVWWWSRKDSHNDYMRIFYQYGLLGFVSYMFFIYHFFKTFAAKNPIFTAFLLTYLFSGLISNGLFFRALPNYIFAIALVATHFPMRIRANAKPQSASVRLWRSPSRRPAG
jgi:hypothetical protein